MYKNNIVVPINNGIHTRIAAMIVHKATEIKKQIWPRPLYKKNGF